MQSNFEIRDYQETLAHTLIEEFVSREGYPFETLGTLDPELVRRLMIKASVYASVRLAEIEDRAQLVTSLHHATDSHI